MRWPWKKRVRLMVAPHGMRDAEIDAVLADAHIEHPMWRATIALANQEIVRLTETALDPKLPAQEMHFALGGVNAVTDLRNLMLDRRQRELERREKVESKTVVSGQ